MKYFSRFFREPTLAERIQRELDHAKHRLLDAYNLAEDAEFRIRVYESRIARLTAAAQTGGSAA